MPHTLEGTTDARCTSSAGEAYDHSMTKPGPRKPMFPTFEKIWAYYDTDINRRMGWIAFRFGLPVVLIGAAGVIIGSLAHQ